MLDFRQCLFFKDFFMYELVRASDVSKSFDSFQDLLIKDGYYIYQHKMTINFPMKIYAKKGLITKIETVNIPDLSVFSSKNSILTGKCCVVDGEKNIVFRESCPVWLLDKDLEAQKEYIKKFMGMSFNDNNNFNPVNDLSSRIFLDGVSVFIGSHTDSAFSHFMFETFAKIFVFLNELNNQPVRYIVSDTIKAYQLRLLIDFGIPEDKIFLKNIKDNIMCERLLFIESPSHNNLWISPKILNSMRSSFLSKYPTSDYNSIDFYDSKDVYIDRKDERESFRAIDNYTDLERILDKRGVRSVTIGKLNFMKKVELFQVNPNIYGQYGGGTQLAFLARRDTSLKVIQSPYFYRSFLSFVGYILGFDVYNIIGEKIVIEKKGDNNSNFMINADVLDSFFELK